MLKITFFINDATKSFKYIYCIIVEMIYKPAKVLLVISVVSFSVFVAVIGYYSLYFKNLAVSSVSNQSMLKAIVSLQKFNMTTQSNLIARLKANISNLTAKLNSIALKESSFEQKANISEGDISAYQNEVSSLNNQIINLKDEINGLNFSYNNVYNAYNTLESSIGGLLSKISLKNSIISNMSSEIALNGKIIKNMSDTIKNMSSYINKSEKELNADNVTINILRSNITSLKRNIENLSDYINETDFVISHVINLSQTTRKNVEFQSIASNGTTMMLVGNAIDPSPLVFLYNKINSSLTNISNTFSAYKSYKFLSVASNSTGFLILAIKSTNKIIRLISYNQGNVSNITMPENISKYISSISQNITHYDLIYGNGTYLIILNKTLMQSTPPQKNPTQNSNVVIGYSQSNNKSENLSFFRNYPIINNGIFINGNYYLFGFNKSTSPSSPNSIFLLKYNLNENTTNEYDLSIQPNQNSGNISLGWDGANLLITDRYTSGSNPPGPGPGPGPGSPEVINRFLFFNPITGLFTNITTSLNLPKYVIGNMIWNGTGFISVGFNGSYSWMYYIK